MTVSGCSAAFSAFSFAFFASSAGVGVLACARSCLMMGGLCSTKASEARISSVRHDSEESRRENTTRRTPRASKWLFATVKMDGLALPSVFLKKPSSTASLS